jgi:hypothetical protein
MRIQVGSAMFANAVGGVCAHAGVESDARVRSAPMSAKRILMRDVKSNRNAKAVFAETRKNLRGRGQRQREDAEGNQTEMFRRVCCGDYCVDLLSIQFAVPVRREYRCVDSGNLCA